MQLVNKYLAKFVRWIRQYFVDIEIGYWVSPRGSFISTDGLPATVDKVLDSCLRDCHERGINNISDYVPKIAQILRIKKNESIIIRHDGITYTLTINFIRIE